MWGKKNQQRAMVHGQVRKSNFHLGGQEFTGEKKINIIVESSVYCLL